MSDQPTDTRLTLAQFIEREGLTMEATPAPGNPHMSERLDSRHFSCAIRHTDNRRPALITPFSVGPGIVEQWVERKYMEPPPSTRYYRPGTVAYQEIVEKHAKEYRPELPDLLDCLASDAATVENARSFEEWAEDLGYGEDSRKGYRTWEVCCQQARELKALLGREAYETLLWETERE